MALNIATVSLAEKYMELLLPLMPLLMRVTLSCYLMKSFCMIITPALVKLYVFAKTAVHRFMPICLKIRGEIYIRLGMLDDEPDVKAEYHWWVQDKAAWYDIHDTLPQFSTVPSGKY